ncbi:MAG: DNA primase [Thermodesulfobacteriota bacterium]|nr:MAG: DNA primase [Thermodesulfobacteriota bacterium]
MSSYIPEDVLRNVLEAANIRQVVGEFVPLKKSGRNWIGLCPFHPDKDPSFSVSEEKQIFHCFGCGEGGDVFKFLMKMQGMSFVEAVKALANRYGIIIPERPRSSRDQKRHMETEELVSLNLAAAEFYHRNILHSPEASDARAYLESRGLKSDTISGFRLGWANDRWDGLINHLKTEGLSLDRAEKAGLLVSRKSGKGYYDRFRGRIIFPILDRSGKVVALGGRILEDGHPKYLNSPETPVYNKSRVLYGLSQNKGAIRRAGKGYVVEGYMDLLALAQFNIDQVVATLGTALTEDHVKQLRGLCKDWILVFDGDAAGVKAALRALPFFYKLNLRVRVLVLPAEDDPDSFVRREGKEALDALVDTAGTGLDFAIQQGLASYGKDPEGRFRTTEDVLSILQPVSDPVRKSLLVGHVAQKLGVREESLWERLNVSNSSTIVPNIRKRYELSVEAKIRKGPENRAEAKLISFLLGYPQYMKTFLDAGLDLWLEVPSLRNLWMAMSHLYSMSGNLNLPDLYDQLEPVPELRTLALRLSADFAPFEDMEEKMLSDLKRYCEDRRNKVLRWNVLEQIKAPAEIVDDEDLLRQILQLR